MDKDLIKQNINVLYQKYSNDVYQYIFFMIGEHDQAKDILQDTFLRAYNKYESFNGDNAKSWLFKIARNLTIDYIRKRKPIFYIIDSITSINATDRTPEQMLVLNETEHQLYKALSKIKRSYRDVIVLRKMKEFSISESSHILGWTESKVKVTLFRGMKALKKELEKEGYSHDKF
ncbi:RNA polymerase sigma factor [Aquibacillus albus]|uniref:RNA polymerase sigma-70 factor (ECF subfamily) n=1 Tax=Aquibacillus albus TaxID=1168171 RepID=A0ABS2N1A9_9BACI|nr:RNA polymerase sigma factor [Aquibacillus albus]MBM7571929.1 RNA polymerase sigma-70 factor (ECF subfamily) [Aquibacillus albus]